MLTVEILGYDDLPKEIKETTLLSNNGPGEEWASYLIIKEDGVKVRLESSAMEPEDVSFYRDLAWVKDAILEAYQTGLIDGKTST